MAFSLRKGRAAVLKAVVLGLVVILALLIAFIAWIVRSPLPKIDGSISVSGIATPVTIRRDGRGIPHIEASSEADLFFGEGFACGQDRLWQMDLLRRTAEGKLSEIVGPAALGIDRYMRTLGLATSAQHDATMLGGQALKDATAYAAGVNLAETHHLPLEFRLLGYRPQPWTPTDSIAIIKLMAQRVDDLWDRVELRALVQRKIGVVAANALLDAQVPGLEHFIQPDERRGSDQRSAAIASDLSALAADGFESNPFPPDHQSGSNNWTVAGRLVSTGKPVLSNDTHLEHSVPSTYWLVHLNGAGIDVEGFIIPGIPFVALGHNQRIAFGVTSGDVAVQDVFVEKFRSATSDEYLANGRWVKASHRRESIAVKGGALQVLDVLVTRHGPIVKRDGASAYALAWTILRGGDELDLLRDLDRAANWKQFEGGLSHVVGPIFNWVYADVDGNIGYHLAGKVPHRLAGDGSLPVEGQDSRYDWHGYLPFDQLPHAFNPSRGFIATANNQLAPANTPVGSSPFYDSPYRVDRIYKRLSIGGHMTPEEIGAIQLDNIDTARSTLAHMAVQALQGNSDARMSRIAAELAQWKGERHGRLAGAHFPHRTRALVDRSTPRTKTRIDADRTLPKGLRRRCRLRTRHEGRPVARLHRPNPRDAARGTTERVCARSRCARYDRRSRSCVYRCLGKQERRDLRSSPWSPMAAERACSTSERFLRRGTASPCTPQNQNTVLHRRLIDDVSNWDNSSMLLTLGESGQFNNKHYQDEVDDFSAARWVPLAFSDAAVKAATKDTLILIPNL